MKCRSVFTGRVYIAVLLLGLILWQSTAIADIEEPYPRVALLYPTVNKHYSHMFEQMIEGITSVKGYEFIIKRVDANSTHDELKNWATENRISAFIALGQTTYNLAASLHRDLPLIAGGMVAAPPGVTGISMVPDPEAFFRHLQVINPDIHRVFFIYSKRNNGWLISDARKVSQRFGVEFVPLEIEEVEQAVIQYETVLRSMQTGTDALWIPLDNVAPLDFLMPQVLKTAWNNKVTIISSNVTHARRGVLFALYPDHYRQGRRLVALLGTRLSKPDEEAVLLPTVNLKIAVNLRTASHLNLKFSRELIAGFDQVYPAYQ